MLYMSQHRKGPPTADLAAEYAQGATTTELAAKYGMAPSGVNGRLKRAGTVLRPARRVSIGDTSANQIISAYQAGLSMADISKQVGVTHSTIQRTLSACGVKIRPHGTRSRAITIPANPFALGYLSGLFDGEGNLQFKDKHQGRSIGCRISIYSTTPGVMRWLIGQVGGKVRYDTKRTETKGWLPIGTWSLYRAQDVSALLSAMLPHLIIKKQAAENALRLFRTRFEIQDSPPTITQSR